MNNISELFESLNEPETEVTSTAIEETSVNESESEIAESDSQEETSESSEESNQEEQKLEQKESRANRRIRELNDAKKVAESKAKELEDRLAEIVRRQEEISKLPDGEMPDPSKFETMQDYINAITEAKVIHALKEQEIKRVEQEKQIAQEKYVTEVVSNYESKITEAAKSNPDIVKAYEHLNKISNHIPVEVREALLTDENAAQLTWEIATNQEILDYVVKQRPTNSIKLLAKLSSQFDIDVPDTVTPMSPTKPTAFQPNPKVPQVPKSKPATKSYEELSPSEYFRKYRSGKIDKKPWEL